MCFQPRNYLTGIQAPSFLEHVYNTNFGAFTHGFACTVNSNILILSHLSATDSNTLSNFDFPSTRHAQSPIRLGHNSNFDLLRPRHSISHRFPSTRLSPAPTPVPHPKKAHHYYQSREIALQKECVAPHSAPHNADREPGTATHLQDLEAQDDPTKCELPPSYQLEPSTARPTTPMAAAITSKMRAGVSDLAEVRSGGRVIDNGRLDEA
jgi:hypothetical protein